MFYIQMDLAASNTWTWQDQTFCINHIVLESANDNVKFL